jgi:hypothetical protein
VEKDVRALGVVILLTCSVQASLAAAPEISIQIQGNEHVIYSYQRDRCDRGDIPDSPLRAIRVRDGAIVAYAGNDRNRSFIGNSLLELRHSCDVAIDSARNPDPAKFDYLTWIDAPWTLDGTTVNALFHEEFHGNEVPGACQFNTVSQCWYNAVTYGVSRDAGRHFTIPNPVYIVAAARFKHDAEQGRPRGFFNPSNIVETNDAFYTLIFTQGGEGQERGACLFRLLKFDKPWAWRAFDGHDFSASAENPYAGEPSPAKPCRPVGSFSNFISSLVRHAPSGWYIALTREIGNASRGTQDRIEYTTSKDLINWSEGSTLIEILGKPPQNCGPTGYVYPAILDPQSPRNNFDDVGDTAFLFLTKLHLANCQINYNRDLVRFPIRIFVKEK